MKRTVENIYGGSIVLLNDKPVTIRTVAHLASGVRFTYEDGTKGKFQYGVELEIVSSW